LELNAQRRAIAQVTREAEPSRKRNKKVFIKNKGFVPSHGAEAPGEQAGYRNGVLDRNY